MSIIVYRLVWSHHPKMLLKCAAPCFLFGCLVSFTLNHLCSFHKSWQRWIEEDWNKVQRYTCCIRSLKSVKENICKGPSAAKKPQIHRSPINNPLFPFSVSENRKCFLENFSPVVTGFPMIYRLHRLLQPLQNSLKKEKGVKSKSDH